LAPHQVKANLEKYGPNILTPIKTTSEWVRFVKNMFGGFQILLWIGAVLCFIAIAVELTTKELPLYDNVSE
jgi:sodium/potassium-transporting ATPase subunit alpha